MGTVPQLGDDDIQKLQGALRLFMERAEARLAMIAAEGGFVIFTEGNPGEIDITVLGAVASNSFLANQTIAQLIDEPRFSSVYQQGERSSVYIQSIDGSHLLIILFPVTASVGAIKHYAQIASAEIAHILKLADERNPGAGVDLATLNVTDSLELFKKAPKS